MSISGSLLFIIVGATTFAQLLSFSGATAGLVALIEGSQLSPITVLIGMLAVLLILGFFIDQTSIMMITLPFYMPILRTMGVDLVWFGILYLLCMQIGLLTPPFGLLLFVLKGVAPPGITIGTIYRAAIPYVWLTMLMMALIFFIPAIVTAFVPGRYDGRRAQRESDHGSDAACRAARRHGCSPAEGRYTDDIAVAQRRPCGVPAQPPRACAASHRSTWPRQRPRPA